MITLSSMWHICTISNIITVCRIALIPSVVGSIKNNQWGAASLLFAIAAISDVADGYIARLLQQQTLFGAILDPVADKLLLLACYISFVLFPNRFFAIPLWFVYTMFIKEIVLLVGTYYVCLVKGFAPVKPTMLGKFTMVLQSVVVGSLLIGSYFNIMPVYALDISLYIISICAIVALFDYVTIAFGGIYS